MVTIREAQIDRIRSRTGVSHSGLGWFAACDGPNAVGIPFHSSRKLTGRVLVFWSGFRWDAGAAVHFTMERDAQRPRPGFS